MSHKSIKYKINHLIIYPLVVSFLAIAATISFSLIAVDKQRVEKIKSHSFDFNKYYLRDLAKVVGVSFQSFTQDILNDLTSFNSFLIAGLNGKISLVSSITPKTDPSYYTNALNFAFEGPENIGFDIPGYDEDTEISVYRPMWFINRDITDITQTAGFQKVYEQFVIALPMMYSLYTSGKYSEIYSVTLEKAPLSRKLYATYPLDRDFNKYVTAIISGPWWDMANQKFSHKKQATLLNPYYISGQGYYYTACVPNYFAAASFAEVNINCFNYQIQKLQDSLQDINGINDLSYFVIDRTTCNVILHPNLESLTINNNVVNITQAEFNSKNVSSSEAADYISKFLALNSSLSSTNYYMEYTRNGQAMVLVLTPVLVSIGTGQTLSYLAGVTQTKSYVYNYYSSFGDDVTQHMTIQLVGLGVTGVLLITCYLLIGSKIEENMIRSMKDLTRLGQSIVDYWNTEGGEYILNTNDDTMISISDPNSKKKSCFSYFKETDMVNENFNQIMEMVRCAKEAQNATNDAEALTGYSRTLKIYRQLKHTKGLSIAYSNIARLHHKNQRIGEAILNYQKAISMIKLEMEKIKDVQRQWTLEQMNVKKKGFFRKKKSVELMDSSDHEITMSLDKLQRDLKLQLAERFYEFGRCLIEYGKKTSGPARINSLKAIKTVFGVVIKHDKELGANMERVLICYLIVSLACIELNDSAEVEKNLNIVEKALEDYKINYNENDIEQEEGEEVMVIPPTIFEQNLMFQRALFLKKAGKIQEAFGTLTFTLEMGIKYDPHIRKRCLLEIKSILDDEKLYERVPNIQKLLETYKKKPKDIMVLLDCSQSMGQGARLRLLVKNLLKMFDKYLKPNDRMGYITFNLNCDVVFGLTEKKKNTNQLRKLVEAMPRPLGGTALYNAINEAIKLIYRAEARNSSKWILALTDGDDKDSRITFEQIYKRLARSDINLLIIGLALHENVTKKMNYLCKVTEAGVFVESQSEDRLDEAFSIAMSVIYGQEFECEEIAFRI